MVYKLTNSFYQLNIYARMANKKFLFAI